MRTHQLTGVESVLSDMCPFGKVARSPQGEELPMLKATRWASNSPKVLSRLRVRCSNRDGYAQQRHRHTVLAGSSRTEAAAVYPPKLCLEILRGLRDQLDADGVSSDAQVIAAMTEQEEQIGLQDVSYNGFFFDDVSGEHLPKRLVIAARCLEMDLFREKRVYTKVPITEAWEQTGKAPIPVKWIDTNKGDIANPEVRSRLVAKEFNKYKDNELYAATPPLEALRLFFS